MIATPCIHHHAASMKTLLFILPFLISDVVQLGDKNRQNYLRLLQITLLCVYPVASVRSVDSLQQLIASHNFAYARLYPHEPFPPKLHYMLHLPQIVKYGPLRTHWCMRYEAKNGFFKQKRWFNSIILQSHCHIIINAGFA